MGQIVSVILVLLLSSCKERVNPLPKLSGDAVILAFGDSLTRGSGASANNDYPSILAGLSKHEVINEGVPGEISADGLKRLPALLDNYQPAMLIVIHGGNDILKKIPGDVTANNLKNMINEAKSRNINVVMLGVPKPGFFFLESAEIYQKLAEENNITTDLDTLPDILGDKKLKSDPIHPNNEGYKLMATKIFELLKDTGAL
jgi:lysophospholipase L1-like esterase